MEARSPEDAFQLEWYLVCLGKGTRDASDSRKEPPVLPWGHPILFQYREQRTQRRNASSNSCVESQSFNWHRPSGRRRFTIRRHWASTLSSRTSDENRSIKPSARSVLLREQFKTNDSVFLANSTEGSSTSSGIECTEWDRVKSLSRGGPFHQSEERCRLEGSISRDVMSAGFSSDRTWLHVTCGRLCWISATRLATKTWWIRLDPS